MAQLNQPKLIEKIVQEEVDKKLREFAEIVEREQKSHQCRWMTYPDFIRHCLDIFNGIDGIKRA